MVLPQAMVVDHNCETSRLHSVTGFVGVMADWVQPYIFGCAERSDPISFLRSVEEGDVPLDQG